MAINKVIGVNISGEWIERFERASKTAGHKTVAAWLRVLAEREIDQPMGFGRVANRLEWERTIPRTEEEKAASDEWLKKSIKLINENPGVSGRSVVETVSIIKKHKPMPDFKSHSERLQWMRENR